MNDWRGVSKQEWMERAIAAEKRAEEAETLLALADRYGADQWRRGNAGQEPQEFDEWQREQTRA